MRRRIIELIFGLSVMIVLAPVFTPDAMTNRGSAEYRKSDRFGGMAALGPGTSPEDNTRNHPKKPKDKSGKGS
jgi:hypothetical protein